jgi:hypothetical protein
MQNIEEQLATIGFAKPAREPAFWNAVRLDRPVRSARPVAARLDPACSRALMRWRDLLARSPQPSPYRIFRA